MADEMFTTVRRGYDPAEVEKALGHAQAEVAELRSQLQAAETDAQQARSEASSFSPSMSTFGSALSSQRGSPQADLPRSAMTAGIIVMRTTRASTAMPKPSAKAIGPMVVLPENTKLAKTAIMMSAAASTTRAPWA